MNIKLKIFEILVKNKQTRKKHVMLLAVTMCSRELIFECYHRTHGMYMCWCELDVYEVQDICAKSVYPDCFFYTTLIMFSF